MRGQSSGSCGWCHTLNPTTVRFCQRPGCAVRPDEQAQAVRCQRCGAFVAWVTVSTRESLENPLGEQERRALAEYLLWLTDGGSGSGFLCARCRRSASARRPPGLRDDDCEPPGGV